MIECTATARVQRLVRWLEPFQRCFGYRAQRLALSTYVYGLFSDSECKSMQAMLARVTEPISYQAFQHFITHAVWDADRIWRRLLEVVPERQGVLIIDGTEGGNCDERVRPCENVHKPTSQGRKMTAAWTARK